MRFSTLVGVVVLSFAWLAADGQWCRAAGDSPPVFVSVSCNKAAEVNLFTPQERATIASLAGALSKDFEANRFRPWKFTTTDQDGAAKLQFFVEYESGTSPSLSLALTFVSADGDTQPPIRDLVLPFGSFPVSTDLLRDITDKFLPSFLKAHSGQMLTHLLDGAPVGAGGFVENGPAPINVGNAMALLLLDWDQFHQIGNLGFRVLGTCGDSGQPIEFGTDPADPSSIAGRQSRAINGQQVTGIGICFRKQKAGENWVSLNPGHAHCLNGFTVVRVYLLSKPYFYRLAGGRTPAVASPP